MPGGVQVSLVSHGPCAQEENVRIFAPFFLSGTESTSVALLLRYFYFVFGKQLKDLSAEMLAARGNHCA